MRLIFPAGLPPEGFSPLAGGSPANTGVTDKETSVNTRRTERDIFAIDERFFEQFTVESSKLL
jgi:hypothetical protein